MEILWNKSGPAGFAIDPLPGAATAVHVIFPMEQLIKLAAAKSIIDGIPVAVHIDGLPPLAVFRVGNELFVTDNVCTHGNAFLHEGFQDSKVIECPFHGGAFNIGSGDPVRAPCTIPLKTYRVILAGGFVCIERPTVETLAIE
jgi:ethylbenzene dioxygenase ferredoxin subunit